MREIHKPETTGKGQSCVKGPGGEEHPTIGDAFRRAAVLVHEARALLPRPLDTVRRKP